MRVIQIQDRDERGFNYDRFKYGRDEMTLWLRSELSVQCSMFGIAVILWDHREQQGES